jgi:hypothetical protein
MRCGDYEEVLQIMQSGKKWESLLERLRDLMVSTEDRELRIYVGDVLRTVSSPYVATMGVSQGLPLPLHQPPFRTLVAYCERQIQLSGRNS